MIWHKENKRPNVEYDKSDNNRDSCSWCLLDNKRKQYTVIDVKNGNKSEEKLYVCKNEKTSEDGIIYNKFEKDKNNPNHTMVDVDGFYSFEEAFHNANLFFFLTTKFLR